MKLETATILVEVVNGVPVPRGVTLGDQLIHNVFTARVQLTHGAPLRLMFEVNVAEVRTEVIAR